MYKALIKRKKISYINRRQVHLLHISNLEPKMFWSKTRVHKMKESKSIPLKNWVIYLKFFYDFPNTISTILNTPIEVDIFSLEVMEFQSKWLASGKTRDIEGYHDEVFKMGRCILIRHIQKLLKLTVRQGFHKSWTHALLCLSFKAGIKTFPLTTRPSWLAPHFSQIVWTHFGKKISFGLKSMVKELKQKLDSGDITQL